jgi:tryptophan synthase alpha chain
MNKAKRIDSIFKHGKAYVGYLTAGDGGMQQSLNAALALIKGGVNILEIGVPFSDPIADGPVIQRAATRALANGTTMRDILKLTTAIRKQSDIPLVLFSYYNPILANINPSFFDKVRDAGIDGILLVDCPLEESEEFHKQCIMRDIAPIYVLTPATSIDRMQLINEKAQGFLYYACRKGTTGMKNELPADLAEKIQLIKANTTLPLVVGFGISNREMAADVLKYADGFVIGSRFVKAIEDGVSSDNLCALAQALNPIGN